MSVTAYKTAGTVANLLYDPLTLGAGTQWTSPTSVQGAADATYATLSYTSGAVSGEYYSLYAHNYGFTTTDIPTGSTINGIEFRMTRHLASTGAYVLNDYHVYFVPASGAAGQGNDLSALAAWSSTGDEQKIFGGATELAGQTWVAADPLDTDFGIHVNAQRAGALVKGSSGIASVDSIECRVYYTAPGSHDPGKDFLGFF